MNHDPLLAELLAPCIAVLSNDRPSLKQRFDFLRTIPANHDGEGAPAANQASLDAAITFLTTYTNLNHLDATMDYDGMACIEVSGFTDRLFGRVTFGPGPYIEAYRRRSGCPSRFAGADTDPNAVTDILTELGFVLRSRQH